MPWPPSLRALPPTLFELALNALEIATGIGLISGTAVALAIGKFMLAGVLALVLLGIVLRFTRRRARGRQGGDGKRSPA